MSVFFVSIASFVRGIVTLLFTHHTLARHELQEEARFARTVRDEDVLPRRRMARRGLDDVAAEHRVEERDELELGEGVADADAGARADGGETPRVADSSAAGAGRVFHNSVPPSKRNCFVGNLQNSIYI